MTLGTPAAKFTVQLDTGSSDLAIPGYTCQCGTHYDSGYNPKSSSTSAAIACSGTPDITCPSCENGQCGYNITYGDGSGFSAVSNSDLCNVAGVSFQQIFGEITSEKTGSLPYFEPPVIDGICGVAYPILSEVNASTIIDNMYQDGYIDNIFSMCMTDQGGSLTLGGIGGYYSGSIQYTPIVKELYYNVYLADIDVFGKSIGVPAATLNKGDVIVDSGTTLIYLSSTPYNALKTSFLNSCPSSGLVGVCDVNSQRTIFDGYCVSLTQAQVNAYPPITIKFGQSSPISLNILPSTYLQQGFCSNPSSYALAIGSGGLDLFGNIFGDTFMQNFETIFDRANTRLGFGAVSNCPAA